MDTLDSYPPRELTQVAAHIEEIKLLAFNETHLDGNFDKELFWKQCTVLQNRIHSILDERIASRD
jgi:hypothetical protein